MATVVEMPKLGNTVEECLLSAWRRREGESVAAGEVLAEIETDKASFELTAPVAGVLLARFFDAGALVPVYTPVCVVGARGESVDSFRPAASAVPMAREARSRPAAGAEAGPGQAVSSARPASTSESGSPTAPAASASAWTPRARRFAREHDFHPQSTVGTGPHGRVVEADLEALRDASPADVPAVTRPERPETAGVGFGGSALRERPVGKRLSFVRETIARRLREGLASTAQYTLHGSANAGPLLALHARLEGNPDTADVSVANIVLFCAVRALLEAPELNAELIDGTLYQHESIDIAFNCDVPRGEVAPVIRSSQDLSLLDLARRMNDLADQAYRRTIAVDDLHGATFTVSNRGMLGVEGFTPLLNPPQVAILGVDAIQVRPVRKPDGNIEFIDAIGLSVTLDHQVVDGGPGARFLRIVKEKLESVEALCTI
jgi:pyruvate dehydrogenase E2 component (dihydrolipoamide acetyltransferase)